MLYGLLLHCEHEIMWLRLERDNVNILKAESTKDFSVMIIVYMGLAVHAS